MLEQFFYKLLNELDDSEKTKSINNIIKKITL